MAVGMRIFPHDHKWRRWVQRKPDSLTEIAEGVYLESSSKHWAKAYKCWKCGQVADETSQKRMANLTELRTEYDNLKKLMEEV